MGGFEPGTAGHAYSESAQNEVVDKRKQDLQSQGANEELELNRKIITLLKRQNGLETFLNIQERFMGYSVQNSMRIYFSDPKARDVRSMEDWNSLGGTVVRQTRSGKQTGIRLQVPIEENGKMLLEWKNMYDIRSVQGIQSPVPERQKPTWEDLERYITNILKGLDAAGVAVVADPKDGLKGRIHFVNQEMILYANEPQNKNVEAIFHEIVQNASYAWFAILMSERGADEKSGKMTTYDYSELGPCAICVEYIVCEKLGLSTEQVKLSMANEILDKMSFVRKMTYFEFVKSAAKHLIHDIDEQRGEKGE